MSSDNTKAKTEEPRGVMRMFRGISLSQLVAGALASVTALFLSTHIGLAGSLIGAAVSFAISSVSAQVFNNVLKDSQKQLMNVVGGQVDSEGDTEESDPKASDGAPRRAVSSADGVVSDSAADGSTTVMPPAPGGRVAVSGRAGVPPVPPPPAPGGSAALKQPRAVVSGGLTVPKGTTKGQAQQRISRRRVIAIVLSVVTALVGVASTALIVMALTGGKGTDTVVKDVFVPQPTQSQTVDSGSQYGQSVPDGQQGGTGTGTGTENDSTSDSTGSQSSSGTSSGTTTDSSSGTGSTGSESSSGTGTGSGTGSSSGTGTGSTGSESSSSGSSSGTDTGTGSGTGTGTTGSESSSGSSSGTGSGTGSSSGTGTGSTGSESSSSGSSSSGSSSSSDSSSSGSSSSSGTGSNTAEGGNATVTSLR